MNTINIAGVEHIIHNGPIAIGNHITTQGLRYYAQDFRCLDLRPRTLPCTRTHTQPITDRMSLRDRLAYYATKSA